MNTITKRPSNAIIEEELRRRIIHIPEGLGQGKLTKSSGPARYGSKGSLSVTHSGEWYDFEAARGGYGGLSLVRHLKKCGENDAIAWGQQWLAGGAPAPDDTPNDDGGEADETKRLAARALFDRAEDVEHDGPVAAYLSSRGLMVPYPACILHLEDARPGEDAVIGVLTDEQGEAVAFQVGYIDAAGNKSDVEPKRRIFKLEDDGVKRGAFRMPGGRQREECAVKRIGVCEGLEDALSLAMSDMFDTVLGVPGVSNFSNVRSALPKGCEVVVVLDGDDPEKAAHATARKGLAEMYDPDRYVLRVVDLELDQDANSILQDSGDAALKELVDAAEVYEPDCVEDEIPYLARLDSADFDRRRATVASKYKPEGIRATTIDNLVEKSRRAASGGRAIEDEDDHAAAAALEELGLAPPEPWPDPVDLADVLDETVQQIGRFVATGKHEIATVALWVAHAHIHDLLWVSPRLAIQAPDRGCGKTTLLEVTSQLVPSPLMASSTTAAAIFRLLKTAKPTLFFDEADRLLANNSDELLAVLNSGHRKNGAVIRAVERDGDYVSVRFPTWAATAFAGIGKLPGTVQDRSIPIEMRRARPGEVKEHLEDGTAPELGILCQKLARWAVDYTETLSGDPVPRPDMGGVANRLADNWRPLIAVADEAGGAWPGLSRECLERAIVRLGDDASLPELLLRNIRDVFADRAQIPSNTLVAALNSDEEAPWSTANKGKEITQEWLARRLRPLIKLGDPADNRLAAKIKVKGQQMRGYCRWQFDDTFERYLPPIIPPELGGTVEPEAKNDEITGAYLVPRLTEPQPPNAPAGINSHTPSGVTSIVGGTALDIENTSVLPAGSTVPPAQDGPMEGEQTDEADPDDPEYFLS